MRIVLLLLLAFGLLLADTTLHGDIDNDGKEESLEFHSIGSNASGTFYQLIVRDDNGRVLWRAPQSRNTNARYAFFEAHFGISMPQLLVDIDDDGYMELIAPEPQSDVSPTYYRKLRWERRRFTILPSLALMMQDENRFRWQKTRDYQGTWVSKFLGSRKGLVKVAITRYENNLYQSGKAWLRFRGNHASVEQWIEPLGTHSDSNEEESIEEESAKKPPTNTNTLDLHLKIVVDYSPQAKAKLQKSGEKVLATLILDQYGKKYMEVEGVASKDMLFDTQHDIMVESLHLNTPYQANKNYKLTIMIISARKHYHDNLLECYASDGAVDYSIDKLKNATLYYTCRLNGENYTSSPTKVERTEDNKEDSVIKTLPKTTTRSAPKVDDPFSGVDFNLFEN